MSAGVRATLIWNAGDTASPRRITSSFVVEHDGVADPGQAAVDSVATLANDWWSTGVGAAAALKTKFEPNVILIGVDAQTVGGSGTPLVSSLTLNVPGTYAGASDEGTPDACVLISWQTDEQHLAPISGRLVRTTGRMYLPPPPMLEVSANGLLDNTFGGSIEDIAEGLHTAADALANFDLAVYREAANTFATVTNARVSRTLGTQRKRKVKRAGYFN